MRPIPVPDQLVGGGCKRVVIGPPGGDLLNTDCAPVEALVGIDPTNGPIITMLVALEPGDLDRLAAMDTPAIWLTMYTPQIPPFAVEVADGQG